MTRTAARAPQRSSTRGRPALPAPRGWRATAKTKGAPPALCLLALVGAGLSSYLTIAHYGHHAVACGGLGQCDLVNTSPYAAILGLPVSALGLALYLSLLAAALAWFARPRAESVTVLYWSLALAGAGYAFYLTYVELALLHAICVWCMASATVLAASLTVSTIALIGRE